MKETEFLTLSEIIEIHSDQIKRYGGSEGLRDINLLSSAVAMPYATFSGDFLHRDIFEMAAAYAFHICRNHPFVDGNKRTALASALVFLELNRISIRDPEEKLFYAMINIASGKMTKEKFAELLRELNDGLGK
jgi:death-on-curing protein